MKEYVENMKEYAENMKKYPLLYRLWNLEKFRDLPLYIGFGTWKYSELSPYVGSGPLHILWGLEKSNL